ncbi:hypothetical protein BDQ12DRAFT_129812 [Crucibulum laeve]|uniref:Uncharacterized protein n=1 Tax=Crucibulum laeve TaxID=68775 RepID=A0A5C3LRT9_9AGAR|nr:hypothetical protein BDQ12DRAFT_129812 [Crucibulum laeve]
MPRPAILRQAPHRSYFRSSRRPGVSQPSCPLQFFPSYKPNSQEIHRVSKPALLPIALPAAPDNDRQPLSMLSLAPPIYIPSPLERPFLASSTPALPIIAIDSALALYYIVIIDYFLIVLPITYCFPITVLFPNVHFPDSCPSSRFLQ